MEIVFKNAGIVYKPSSNVPYELKKPDSINFFFVNSVPDLQPDEAFFYTRSNNCNFEFSIITDHIVFDITRSMKNNAAGVGGLNINFIILYCPHILPYLTLIINFFLLHGQFPEGNSWYFSFAVT